MIKHERIHGMDALRGIAMWLGVVLHAVIAYQIDPRGGWPNDIYSSEIMDWVYSYLHAFRMPLFFFVAGFFARFLIQKVKIKAFLIHRTKRILVPFILSALLIVPLCGYIFSIHRLLMNGYYENIILEAIPESLQWTGLYHIWFLYYLLMLYGILIVYIQVFSRYINIPKNVTETGFFVTTILLFSIQYFFYGGYVEPWTGIFPKPGQILYYGYFFGLGYIIFFNIDFLFQNRKLRFFYILIGIIIIFIIRNYFSGMPYWLFSLLVSLQTNLLLLGHLSFFVHIFKKESNWVRYFSDASYWFYLIHLPIVVSLQLLLLYFDTSVWFKVTLVIGITTLISIISYEYLVRYSVVGNMLNGKKIKQRKVNPTNFLRKHLVND